MFTGYLSLMKIILTTNCAAYKLPTVSNFVVLMYLRRTNHPIWQLFMAQCSLFNEEICERSLSPLSSVIQRDTQRHKIEHLEKQYRLTRRYSRLHSVLNEMSERKREATWEGIRLDDQDVTLTVVYLRSMIRKLVAGQFVHYTGAPGDWVSAVVARTTWANVRPEQFFRADTSALFAIVLRKIYVKIINSDFSNGFEVDGKNVDDGDVADIEREEDAKSPTGIDDNMVDDIADRVDDVASDESDSNGDSGEDKKHGSVPSVSRLLVSQKRARGGAGAGRDTMVSRVGGKRRGPNVMVSEKKARGPVSPLQVDAVPGLVASLTEEITHHPRELAARRPHRAAAPIVGQFQSIVQNIQIEENGHLVPISPDTGRHHRVKKKKTKA